MLRELRGALTAFALVLLVLFALANINIWLPGQALLQSLRFHIAVVLLAVLLLLGLSGAWRRALILALPLAAGSAHAGSLVYDQQIRRVEQDTASLRPLFKVVSYNVLTLNPNGQEVVDYLVGLDADVVMLMEATALRSQRARLLEAYPYSSGCIDFSRCGTVILSKTPLSGDTLSSLSEVWPNRLATASTEIAGTRVTLVLAHLVKPYFDDFPMEEVERLYRTLKAVDGPMLLAGDFNAAAWSDNIAWLAKKAKLVPPPYYPSTWPVRAGPLGVPIDNLFTRGALVIDQIAAFDDSKGSNHLGLIAEISLDVGD